MPTTTRQCYTRKKQPAHPMHKTAFHCQTTTLHNSAGLCWIKANSETDWTCAQAAKSCAALVVKHVIPPLELRQRVRSYPHKQLARVAEAIFRQYLRQVR